MALIVAANVWSSLTRIEKRQMWIVDELRRIRDGLAPSPTHYQEEGND